MIKGRTLSSKYGTVSDYETIENFQDLKKFANWNLKWIIDKMSTWLLPEYQISYKKIKIGCTQMPPEFYDQYWIYPWNFFFRWVER